MKINHLNLKGLNYIPIHRKLTVYSVPFICTILKVSAISFIAHSLTYLLNI